MPKQSQMDLPAADNLAYQRACFERAQPSGHTPKLYRTLPCDDALPRGALLVEAIEGRPAQLPDDLPAIARALAALHRLPLPAEDRRAPLVSAVDPWHAMLAEIRDQARYLRDASLAPQSRRCIDAALAALPDSLTAATTDAARCLISFDAHPGNFLIEPGGRAVLVDLEKCRYGLPGFDLAHLSLYTSTSWDVQSRAVLFREDIEALYDRWRILMGDAASPHDWQTLIACRRAMWLWSVTWCAKWRANRSRSADHRHQGEDWSSSLSECTLIAHVQDRVDHYLSLPILERVTRELNELSHGA